MPPGSNPALGQDKTHCAYFGRTQTVDGPGGRTGRVRVARWTTNQHTRKNEQRKREDMFKNPRKTHAVEQNVEAARTKRCRKRVCGRRVSRLAKNNRNAGSLSPGCSLSGGPRSETVTIGTRSLEKPCLAPCLTFVSGPRRLALRLNCLPFP